MTGTVRSESEPLYLPYLLKSDLKTFPGLARFDFVGGKFTNIDGDLFHHTRKLKIINFSAPELQSVGSNLLTGLNDLVYVWFFDSGCMGNFGANTPQMFQELKKKLQLQCPPLEPPTSPLTTPRTTTILPSTTTLSTSTSTQCSVRCNLDSEVDELSSELILQREINVMLQETVSGMSEINRKQDERLEELEKLIREIDARP